MITTDGCEGRSNRLPRNNQNFMLLFARCDGNHTTQCKDQQHKYAKVEYSEYTKEGVQAHQGRRVHCQCHVRCQDKYIEYAKDGMYVANSEHSEYAVRRVCCPRRVWQVHQRRTDPHGTMTMSSHATTVLISEADNIVPHNDQTLSLSLSTKSVNLRPQIN